MDWGTGWRVAVSILTVGVAGCDDGSTSESSGSAGSAGSAGAVGSAGDGGTVEYESTPLSLSEGRVSNAELDVQGTVFAESDTHTGQGMTSNLTAPVPASVVNACIKGTAAKVDQASIICSTKMFTAPATDCWAEYWGAAIGMYLNSKPDDSAQPFDGSALQGFSFELDGAVVPNRAALRFQVEADERLFCSWGNVKIVPGTNRVLFAQLVEDCFRYPTDPPRPSAESVQSRLLKVSWHVAPNDSSEVPFDFCVSNVRALLK
jgi:hypothetical protein